MAEMTIRLIPDPVTGKKNIVISYASDGDSCVSGARNTASCASGPNSATMRRLSTESDATSPSSRCARNRSPIVSRTNSTRCPTHPFLTRSRKPPWTYRRSRPMEITPTTGG